MKNIILKIFIPLFLFGFTADKKDVSNSPKKGYTFDTKFFFSGDIVYIGIVRVDEIDYENKKIIIRDINFPDTIPKIDFIKDEFCFLDEHREVIKRKVDWILRAQIEEKDTLCLIYRKYIAPNSLIVYDYIVGKRYENDYEFMHKCFYHTTYRIYPPCKPPRYNGINDEITKYSDGSYLSDKTGFRLSMDSIYFSINK